MLQNASRDVTRQAVSALSPHLCFFCTLYTHQCAHIMAMAVQRLHKDARVTIGPWIERGFYYDFDMPAITGARAKSLLL